MAMASSAPPAGSETGGDRPAWKSCPFFHCSALLTNGIVLLFSPLSDSSSSSSTQLCCSPLPIKKKKFAFHLFFPFLFTSRSRAAFQPLRRRAAMKRDQKMNERSSERRIADRLPLTRSRSLLLLLNTSRRVSRKAGWGGRGSKTTVTRKYGQARR